MISTVAVVMNLFAKKGRTKYAEGIFDALGSYFTYDKVVKWWDNANNKKMDGFYVDFKSGRFLNPTSIDAGTYSESLKIVRRYLDTVSLIDRLSPNAYKEIESIRVRRVTNG
jgi:hypothetical protein